MGRISIITHNYIEFYKDLVFLSRNNKKLNIIFPFFCRGKLNNYYCCSYFHFLFLFPQVGTGFSFADSLVGFSVNEVEVAENLYSALTQFFMVFSEYKNSDFYLTGEVRDRVVLCTSNALVYVVCIRDPVCSV